MTVIIRDDTEWKDTMGLLFAALCNPGINWSNSIVYKPAACLPYPARGIYKIYIWFAPHCALKIKKFYIFSWKKVKK